MANKTIKLPTEPRDLVAFLAGGLFGSGLLVSGMIDTRKVQGWLDFFGDWDPTLAFVLGGLSCRCCLSGASPSGAVSRFWARRSRSAPRPNWTAR